MPETAIAEMDFKRNLKVDLFPTIWCPGCGIGTIMIQLAMVLDEMGMDETNTVIVSGIGCTGRMGSYMKYEAVYTLHGRTLPVAEAIKTVRPEMNVVVVSGDGDTASIGGNHLVHAIRRNAPLTVLCNNNEIYGLTGGQTGPTTPSGTKTLSSPAGNPSTPINLQGLVRSSPHSLYAKSTVYHQQHLRNAIREAVEHPGFSFVDITSQCIENNGRRIGFASANEMLTFYRKTYKRAPKDADHLNPFEIGVLHPRTDTAAAATNGDGSGPAAPERPEALPEPPPGPLTSATASPGADQAAADGSAPDDEKARRRAESQQRAALMAQLSAEVKMQVARKELSLHDALTAAGIPVPEWLRTGASAPVVVPAAAEEPAEREPANKEPAPPAPDAGAADEKARRRAESQRKLALMQQLPSDLKLRVAKRDISLEDALREAGVDPGASA